MTLLLLTSIIIQRFLSIYESIHLFTLNSSTIIYHLNNYKVCQTKCEQTESTSITHSYQNIICLNDFGLIYQKKFNLISIKYQLLQQKIFTSLEQIQENLKFFELYQFYEQQNIMGQQNNLIVKSNPSNLETQIYNQCQLIKK
ncbi:hypothetical protein pb186bvf_005173 [Paramecium bursaria]